VPEALQYCLFIGFVGLMFLMRLDARRFGAAEWDDAAGDASVWLSRITWYAAGVALGLIIFALHPAPASDLNLGFAPDRGEALFLGLLYGAAGTAAAFVLAILVNGRVVFPYPARYPGGILSAVGTAFFDEFLFRGVLLGVLLSLGAPDWLAVGAAAAIYAGAVRASAGGRGLLASIVALAIGVAGGVVVLMTAGIAAALMGHAIARFAAFMTTGRPPGAEPVPLFAANATPGATGDSRAWLIPPRGARRGGDGDDGRNRIGPVRPV
jgi:hypothetical protein